MQEIIDWNSYSNSEKLAVERRLDQLLGQVVGARLEIADELLLREALQRWRVDVPERRGLQIASYELLRLASRRLDDLASCGLRPAPGSAGLGPQAIKELLDREFFVLSEAYYERYVRSTHPAELRER